MSFKIKERNKNKYIYFQMSGTGDVFLARKGELANKPERVLEALDYVKEKNGHYSKVENELLQYLDQSHKDRYISNRINELRKESESLTSSLSEPALQKLYLSRGKITAEDRTRLRRPEIQNDLKLYESELRKDFLVPRTTTWRDNKILEKEQISIKKTKQIHGIQILDHVLNQLLKASSQGLTVREISKKLPKGYEITDNCEKLIQDGLIEAKKDSKNRFLISDKGKEFLKQFKRFQSLVDDMNLRY